MALKPDRSTLHDDISFFCNDTTAERGGIMCFSTAGSGAAMDQSNAVVTYVANASGAIPVGLLLNDVVNLDLTRQHPNWYKDEVQTGGKVTLGTKGWWVTDRVYPGQTPTMGQLAYVGHSGFIANSNIVSDAGDADGSTRVVGRFLSTKDEDGYAKVAVTLPNTNV